MSTLTGVRPLLKVTLKQDIRAIAPWVLGVAVLSASSILVYAWVFTDPQDRAALSMSLGANPALSLIFGPARDLMTADGFNAWRSGQLGAFLAGLMVILTVTRNSRADEDSGQAELLASGVLARSSRLAVAVLIATIASVAMGVVAFVLTIACGGDPTSTLILSATFTASGLMFTGVAAITAQLGSDARSASSLAVAALGVCYVLRGYIDSANPDSWAAWLTPLGWLGETRPATDNNPWPLLLAVGLAALLITAGFVLQARRDFGQGIIAPRPGPAEAGLAGTIWGLVFKLNRSSLISWLVAFTGIGLLFGTLVTSIGDLIVENPALADVFAAGAGNSSSMEFAFLVTMLQLIAIIAAVMGVQVALHIYDEELAYRVEPLLATSLRRRTYLAANAAIALLGPALAMLLAGTTLGLVAHSKVDSIAVSDVIGQAAATIPAIWILVGIGLAAIGAIPQRRIIAWGGIVATFGLTLLGPTFNLPAWALDISPLRHVPDITGPSPDWAGLVWLLAITATLITIAFTGFRRRDII